jgi:fructuronate reductase
LDRFRNPALTHKLIQIASDGSQKLPYRILGSLQDALKGGRNIRRFTISLGAWMRFVERQAKAGIAFQDPMNDKLTEIGKACTGVAAVDTPKVPRLARGLPGRVGREAAI